MKRALTLAMLCYLTPSFQAHAQEAAKPAPSSFPPPQLELRVPFEPTAFPSGGQTYLAYELYFTNFSGQPLTIGRIDVLNADGSAENPVATLEGEPLAGAVQTFGGAPRPGTSNPTEIAAGATVVAYMWVAFEGGAPVPARLRHRVVASGTSIEGASIGTHHTKLRVLGAPLEGGDWTASDGPSNDKDNHHRRGFVVLDAATVISRRHAIDWLQYKNGASFSGNASDPTTYYAYGKTVLAVASGKVIAARNDLPDNRPGRGRDFRPAVPLTYETLGGNAVTLDIGGGQYAYYFHLAPGSVRVKPGDRVRKGQVLGLTGSSGDAREPHLHFEITNSPRALVGEGVPYVIDSYRAKAGDGTWQKHTSELPLRDVVVEFPRT
jgi:peptidase M23-like protein